MTKRAGQAAIPAPQSPLDRIISSLQASQFEAAFEAPQTIAFIKSSWLALRAYIWWLIVVIIVFRALFYLFGTSLIQSYDYWQQHEQGQEHVTCPICDESHQRGASRTACRECETVHTRTCGHTVCDRCELPQSPSVTCDSNTIRDQEEHKEEISRLRQTVADGANELGDLRARLEEQKHVIDGIGVSAHTAWTRRLEFKLKTVKRQLAQCKENDKYIESLKRDYNMEMYHVNDVFSQLKVENAPLARRYSKPTHDGCFIKPIDDESVQGGTTERLSSRSDQESTSTASVPQGDIEHMRQSPQEYHNKETDNIESVNNLGNIRREVASSLPGLPSPIEIDFWKDSLRSRQPGQSRSEKATASPGDSHGIISFQDYDDVSLKNDFMQLHTAVKTLAFHIRDFVQFPGHMKGLTEISPLIQGTTSSHFRKHKLFLLEGAIWSFLLKTVFANPLEMFGSRAAHLAKEWTSPNTQACAELWRWSTVQALLRSAGLSKDQLTGPSAANALQYVVKNKLSLNRPFPADVIKYTDSIKEADTNSRQSLIDVQITLFKALQKTALTIGVGLGKAEKEIESVTVRAHVLAIKLASQLPRFELVHPSVGTIVDDSTTRGDHPLHEKISACESIRVGHVIFTSRPGLRKWGNQNGDKLNESLDLAPSQVCIQEAVDLCMKSYEPRPKMPPRQAQPQFVSGTSGPRLFKAIKKMAGRPPPSHVTPKNNPAEPSSNASSGGLFDSVDTTMLFPTPQPALPNSTNEAQQHHAYQDLINNLRIDLQDPEKYNTIPSLQVFRTHIQSAYTHFYTFPPHAPLLRATDYRALRSLTLATRNKVWVVDKDAEDKNPRNILYSNLTDLTVQMSFWIQGFGAATLAKSTILSTPLPCLAIKYWCILEPQIYTASRVLGPKLTLAEGVLEEARKLHKRVVDLGDEVQRLAIRELHERSEQAELLSAVEEGAKGLGNTIQDVESGSKGSGTALKEVKEITGEGSKTDGTKAGEGAGQEGGESSGGRGAAGKRRDQGIVESDDEL
ncbi:hypothetical protein BDV96DRAFT_573671 [Lophiotrema nucula]|uniref:Uncharacterized protein n=1 Tax=Lophiotrema nucula TaxID=690887 RepID=A0A6A5ZAI2_9PLEO|nr:hypothetical protein BDV96DRAFT_573671 [Lophiotrema nucula]